MSVRGNVVTGAACALLGLVACGPTIPGVTPGPGPGPNPGTTMGNDDAYASCKDQEKLGDATTCWKKWLVDNGNTGETPQKDYAKMYIAHHPAHNPDLDPTPVPKPGPGPKQDSRHGDVKIIPIDDDVKKRQDTGDNKGSSVQWPQKTAGDKECWDHMKLTGKYIDDYNELIGRCGKATGMLPYSKPLQGELSQDHKGDVYTLKLVGGGCYRLYAVADAGVKDLDVAIATMENKVVWVDKNTQHVAIVEWDKPICFEKDVQFKFIVAIDGAGGGGYAFGIWVRPNSG